MCCRQVNDRSQVAIEDCVVSRALCAHHISRMVFWVLQSASERSQFLEFCAFWRLVFFRHASCIFVWVERRANISLLCWFVVWIYGRHTHARAQSCWNSSVGYGLRLEMCWKGSDAVVVGSMSLAQMLSENYFNGYFCGDRDHTRRGLNSSYFY